MKLSIANIMSPMIYLTSLGYSAMWKCVAPDLAQRDVTEWKGNRRFRGGSAQPLDRLARRACRVTCKHKASFSPPCGFTSSLPPPYPVQTSMSYWEFISQHKGILFNPAAVPCKYPIQGHCIEIPPPPPTTSSHTGQSHKLGSWY